jgi:hypothetical protein
MSVLSKDADLAVRWSTAERVQALKRIVPRASIAKVLKHCCVGERHCRRLPRWFVVWFVIALALFCQDSYRQIFRWLQRFRVKLTPGRSTLCEARKSVGVAPLRLLTNEVVQLLGRRNDPHTFYAGMRLMALDSFVVNVADTPANDRAFGRPKTGRAAGAFPQARVLSLCEVGTHVFYRSLIKPCHRHEVKMAPHLLGFLEQNMLLLWDRSFLSFFLLELVLSRKAHILARLKKHMVFRPIRRFKDGSFLAKLYHSSWYREHDSGGILVRIIEYTFDDPARPGVGEKHRLLTTLLDPQLHPARRLIVLYHERWEEEIAIDEFKTHQCGRTVLRSETPAGVVQEIYGLLLGHFVIRKLMSEAASVAKCEPRDLSFINTLKILRCRLPEVPRSASGIANWYSNLIAEITEERNEPRRDRINPRVIKTKMSRWPKKRHKHRETPQPTRRFDRSIVMLN